MCENNTLEIREYRHAISRPASLRLYTAWWGLRIHKQAVKTPRAVRCRLPQRVVRAKGLRSDVAAVHPDGCIWHYNGQRWVRFFSLPDAQFV